MFKAWLQPVLAGPDLPTLLHAAIFFSLPRPISRKPLLTPPLPSLLPSLNVLPPPLLVAAVAVVPPALTAAMAAAQHMQRHFNAAPLYRSVSLSLSLSLYRSLQL